MKFFKKKRKYKNEQIEEGIRNDNNEIIDWLIASEIGPSILNYVKRNSGTEDDAKDATIHAICECRENILSGKYKKMNSVTGFIATIAKRYWLQELRKEARYNEKGINADWVFGKEEFKEEEHTIVEEYSNMVNKTTIQLNQCFKNLSEDQERTIKLHIYEGLTHEEIADYEGIPAGTVRQRFKRGLAKLKICLDLHLNKKNNR